VIKEERAKSASYTAAKHALEKERDKTKLLHKLQQRPPAIDLKRRNILRLESNGASAESLHAGSTDTTSKLAKFDERRTQLKSILKNRPERADLEHQNIIKSV